MPGRLWFHRGPVLQVQMPQFFRDPLLRAAALGQLGREPEAAQALAELLRLKQDFSTHGPFLIGCYVKFDDLADAFFDGLRLAGLKNYSVCQKFFPILDIHKSPLTPL